MSARQTFSVGGQMYHLSVHEIEFVAKHAVERAELERGCNELQDAFCEVQLFKRRVERSEIGLSDARMRLREAFKRVECLIKQMERNATT